MLADWLRQRTGLSRFGNGLETEAAVLATGTLVERAKHWLHARFAHSVRIAALAAEVGVSRRTLERRFHAYEGISPLDYLQRHRIAVAKRMLQLSDFHLNQITVLVGYSSLPTFARLFKRETGLAPREWRHRARVRSEGWTLPVTGTPWPCLLEYGAAETVKPASLIVEYHGDPRACMRVILSI